MVPNPSTTRRTHWSHNCGSDGIQSTSRRTALTWSLSGHIDESICHTPPVTGMRLGIFSPHCVWWGPSGRAWTKSTALVRPGGEEGS